MNKDSKKQKCNEIILLSNELKTLSKICFGLIIMGAVFTVIFAFPYKDLTMSRTGETVGPLLVLFLIANILWKIGHALMRIVEIIDDSLDAP